MVLTWLGNEATFHKHVVAARRLSVIAIDHVARDLMGTQSLDSITASRCGAAIRRLKPTRSPWMMTRGKSATATGRALTRFLTKSLPSHSL
jgi:hypothetical protein